MKTMTRMRPLLALTAAVLLSGCDITSPLEDVTIHLDVDDLPITLNSGALAVAAGTVSQVTTNVSFGETVSSVESISEITLLPSFLTFTPVAGGPGATAAGMASGVLLVGVEDGAGGPLVAVTVTIANDVVTSVSPSIATLNSMAEGIRSAANAAIAANPSLANRFNGWRTATPGELLSRVNALLKSSGSSLRVVVTPISGNLAGSLSISQFHLSGAVTKAL